MAIEARNQLYTYFETGDVPTAEQFKNLIDSQINQASDRVTALPAGDGTSIIGISNSNMVARLNISGTANTGNLVSFFQTAAAKEFWMLSDTTGRGDGTGGTTRGDVFYREAPLAEQTKGPMHGYETISDNRAMATVALGGLNLTQNSARERVSRLFIQYDGKVGLGTTAPARKLDVSDAVTNDLAGIKMFNTTTRTFGWSAGHLHNMLSEKNGSFSIHEDSDGKSPAAERFTILRGGNVGINEMLPDTKLHVSRSLSDANMLVDFREGTGIAIFGPIEENVTIDSQSIQARLGVYEGSTLVLRDNKLSLQPLGGAIIIHSDDSLSASTRVIITETGELGVGTTSPSEKIEVDGAIKIGDASGEEPGAGTIRWTGSDFQGYIGDQWKSFTEGGQVWLESTDSNSIYYSPSEAKVGIGTSSPSYMLHVHESTAITTGSDTTNSVAAFIRNTSNSENTGITDMRVGLQIVCDSLWSSVDGPTNIGLYISDVSGQPAANENYAAILNGNVVIGDMTGAHLVGTDGTHVLALQNGTAPTAAVDPDDALAGVQIYSSNIEGTPVSTIHIMNGNGKVVKLFEGAALTAAVTTVLTTTYSDADRSVIENLRTRVNDLEARLKALGLLPTA